MPKLTSRAGLTLIEVLLATVLLITVGVGIATFAPQAIKSIVKVHTRSTATSLASSKIEDVKVRPYPVIPVTPNGNYFSSTSPNGPCDCSSADFTQGSISSETFTIGETVYTRQTCVNYVQKTSGGLWQSNCKSDTAMKQIVTNVSWLLGAERQSFTMQSLASPPAQYGNLVYPTGTFAVTVCAADGNVPPACNGAAVGTIQGAEVSIYNGTYTGDNAGVTAFPATVNIAVPPGTYGIHVQKTGFFPYYSPATYPIVAGQTVTSPTIPTVILRDIATYGSKVAGEAGVADHPVISKVIDGYGQPGNCSLNGAPPVCNNASEALELYNPTVSTYTVGAGGLQIQYCSVTSCITTDFTAAPFTIAPSAIPLKLKPNSFLLIVGIDPTNGLPGSWGGGLTPDVTYNPSAAGVPPQLGASRTDGLIP